ncbi:MAG: DUF4097 family beta strand repeat protein [Bdellovibrio sp.]|nr:DUF4097 family beta strand repeat protein [Bdellovibrio sp.]
MKNKNLRIKILFIAAPVALFFGALAVYSTKMAFASDPELSAKVEKAVNQRYGTNYFRFNVQSEGKTLTYLSEVHRFSTETDAISLKVVNADVKINKGIEDKIIVRAEGAGTEKLLNVRWSDKELSIEQNEHHSERLTIEVTVPKAYRNELSLKTVSGEVKIKDMRFANVEIKSVSADIELKNVDQSSLKIETISGGVDLKLSGAADDYNFELKSLSGAIKNQHKAAKNGPKLVKISTISGDLEIE